MSREALNVLIVEDEDDILELYAFCFEAAGFRAVCAESVAAAIEAMRARRFDAVVTDYNLPDGDGLAMLDAAARDGWLRGEVPAVLCTACGTVRRPHGRVRAVFMKPVDTDKLVRVVRDAIAANDENRERDSEEMAS